LEEKANLGSKKLDAVNYTAVHDVCYDYTIGSPQYEKYPKNKKEIIVSTVQAGQQTRR
jgi:hypothetical protein